jgi:hypothetical protein
MISQGPDDNLNVRLILQKYFCNIWIFLGGDFRGLPGDETPAAPRPDGF